MKQSSIVIATVSRNFDLIELLGREIASERGISTGRTHTLINIRRILYRKGRIPWNYARFLDYASERLLMKKVGGGYIFYHRMLMEHFDQRHQVATVPVPVTPRQTYQPIAQAKTRTKVRSNNISNPVPQPSKPIQNHIVCGNCNHQNPITGKFCIKCGTRLSQKI